MKKATTTIAILLLLTSVGLAQQSPSVPDYLQAVSKTIGKPGTLNADGSFRINIPRADVSFVSETGMPIPADLGLTTYFAISGTEDHSLAVGDIALLQPEIDGVVDALRGGGIEVVALHNHMTTEKPRLFFLHFQGIGKASDLAATFKKAVGVLGSVKASTDPVKEVGAKPLDSDALQKALGVKPQVFKSGLLRFANPRKDIKVSVDDLGFTPGMGLGSWAAFYACGCGQTMVMGDTCSTRADLQGVIDALRKGGLHITGIHNHVFGANQQVLFLHFEGEGEAVALATGIRAAWDAMTPK